jgi:4-hydroxy-2-oxoheptanedioate aldolase
MDRTNDELLIVPQIESITAYNNLDEILTVNGIEVFAGGPNDLAQSMGFPGQPDHTDCINVTDEGTDKIHAAGKHRDADIMVSVDATIAVKDAVDAMLSRGSGIKGG